MPNDVYTYALQRIRVLWSDPDIVIWIDLDSERALPQYSSRLELEHSMASGDLQSIPDPFTAISMKSPVAESPAAEVQERAWNAIQEAVKSEPQIYSRQTRGPLISKIMENTRASKQTVYRWLRRYWQYGKSKNALSGRYDNCGGPGKTKNLSNKKIGAPRTRTPGTGVNVDDQIKRIFRVSIEKCLLHEGEYDIDYAYNQVLIAFGVSLPCKPEDLINVPTERQFRYFYEKEYSSLEITRRRKGEINYRKDFRPVLGSSTAEVSGPGSKYQIDATIADIYLVSEQDRSKIVGRPTMYFVVDVFSRAIVGLYIGFENPSWVSAMGALANAVADKEEFCTRYGVKTYSHEWPSPGLPESIISDRGAEILGRHVEVLSEAFGINIENTPPYRADWKGVVERDFLTIQHKMKPFVPGYVTGKAIGKKRHGKDYRLESVLTLNEFTAIIINIVRFYNTENPIAKYDPDSDMPPDLKYIPIELWNWGIENRTGKLRRPDSELVRVNLMPHTTATVTEHGLRVFGCYYSCKEAVEKGWFERNYSGPKRRTIAYDLHSSNSIYIRPTDSFNDYIEARLTPRSREYEDLSMYEVWEKKDIKADVAAKSKLTQRAGSINLTRELESITEEAMKAGSEQGTKKSRIEGISANKRAERQYERRKLTEKLSSSLDDCNEAEVIPINQFQGKKRSFNLPTNLKDLLREKRSDE
jgi:hypothetical protein